MKYKLKIIKLKKLKIKYNSMESLRLLLSHIIMKYFLLLIKMYGKSGIEILYTNVISKEMQKKLNTKIIHCI